MAAINTAFNARSEPMADKGGKDPPQDLVVACPTLSSLQLDEDDRELLRELSRWVVTEKDVNDAFKRKLSELTGTGEARKSAVIRAKVYSRLIAIAVGFLPPDINTAASESDTRESVRESVNFLAFRERWRDALRHDGTIVGYLFAHELEADDEVMTAIFCYRTTYKKYPVPLFPGGDLAVFQEIWTLWLSPDFLRVFYYFVVLEPVLNEVKACEVVKVKGRGKAKGKMVDRVVPLPSEVEKVERARMMLCGLLQRRTVKAGARLLEVILLFRADRNYHVLELLREVVNPLLSSKRGKFRKCFLGGFEKNRVRGEAPWDAQGGFDQVQGGHGHAAMTVGPSSAQTDSNLLCWAARRGYSNLLWCVAQAYTEVRETFLEEDAADELRVSSLWKVALWCAVRHGQSLAFYQLADPAWISSIDFNDYTGIPGCLPPLSLVALLGDRSMLHVLLASKIAIEAGAHKRDYLGKTPLDYAMQSQLTSNKSNDGIMQFEVLTDHFRYPPLPSKEFNDWTQPQLGARRFEYYTYDNDNDGITPTVGRQTVMRQLLQMPGVADRLKELNDMYTTQANFVLVGAALIASVAFAGWLQPPLGYTDYFQFTQPSPPAPEGTFDQYVAVEGHTSVQLFVAFNALSFFLGIGTMLIGAEATLFVHDNDERTVALTKVRKSIKWMLGFFIASMVCIMAAFACAGLAILPPILRLEWTMIVSLCAGASACIVPLSWILISLAKVKMRTIQSRMVELWTMRSGKERKFLEQPLREVRGALVNDVDVKTLQDHALNNRKSPRLPPSSREYAPVYYERPHSPSMERATGDYRTDIEGSSDSSMEQGVPDSAVKNHGSSPKIVTAKEQGTTSSSASGD